MSVGCVICVSPLKETDSILVINCGHIYHATCIHQWISRSTTCPQCRKRISKSRIQRIYFNTIDISIADSTLHEQNLPLEGGERNEIKTSQKTVATEVDILINSHAKILEKEKKKVSLLSSDNASLKKQLANRNKELAYYKDEYLLLTEQLREAKPQLKDFSLIVDSTTALN